MTDVGAQGASHATWRPNDPETGSDPDPPQSAATPSSTSNDDGRQRELTSYLNAALTPFPCCWCPPGGTSVNYIFRCITNRGASSPAGASFHVRSQPGSIASNNRDLCWRFEPSSPRCESGARHWPCSTWHKRPFETLLRTALSDAPDLLAGLNFQEPKRVVADERSLIAWWRRSPRIKT